MFRTFNRVRRAFQFDPTVARGGLDAKFGLERLQVARLIVEKLLRNTRVFEMESFGGHKSTFVKVVRANVNGHDHVIFDKKYNPQVCFNFRRINRAPVLCRKLMNLMRPQPWIKRVFLKDFPGTPRVESFWLELKS